jgi:hypothetical protein
MISILNILISDSLLYLPSKIWYELMIGYQSIAKV